MEREIFEYIEAYYNTIRAHSFLGYLSPLEFQETKNESLARIITVYFLGVTPELLYAPLEDNFVATIKALWQVKAAPRYMTSDILSLDFINALGPAAENFLYTQTVAPESEALNDLKKRYAKRFNRPLETTQLVAWGYDGIGIIAEAIKRSTSSGHPLRDELAETRNYRGASDAISISSGGSVTNYPSMYQVKEGKLEPISK